MKIMQDPICHSFKNFFLYITLGMRPSQPRLLSCQKLRLHLCGSRHHRLRLGGPCSGRQQRRRRPHMLGADAATVIAVSGSWAWVLGQVLLWSGRGAVGRPAALDGAALQVLTMVWVAISIAVGWLNGRGGGATSGVAGVGGGGRRRWRRPVAAAAAAATTTAWGWGGAWLFLLFLFVLSDECFPEREDLTLKELHPTEKLNLLGRFLEDKKR